jgi:hypothetical protein
MSDTADLYETDFALWSDRQAAAIRRRAGNEIDWENVAEEIESLGKSDRREIGSRLAVICAHLLKWQFQPDVRSGSWRGSVTENRRKIAKLIKESPSLKPHPAHVIAEAYDDGREVAEAETGLTLPEMCPWTIDQALDRDFWPEG